MAKHTHGSHLGGAQVIRARNRVQTALFPHSHNTKFLIPKRKQGPIIIAGIAKTVSTTITYDVDIAGGDAVGWTLFNRTTDLPVALVSVINGNTNEIILNYAAQTLGDLLTITYQPGAWTSARGEVNGFTFQRAAVV
jgi:hypothetical protein